MTEQPNNVDGKVLKIIEKKEKTKKQYNYKYKKKSKKHLSPEFFKRVAESIFKHDWKSDKAYRGLFRKFSLIFDNEDTQDLNLEIVKFKEKWFYTPMDIEKILLHMNTTGKVVRVKYQGVKYYLVPEEILKDIENIIRWCYKKLNDYYVYYGINIDGIDIGDMEELKTYM